MKLIKRTKILCYTVMSIGVLGVSSMIGGYVIEHN